MTNAQIILSESIELMNQGIIGTTGRKIMAAYEKVNENGEIGTVEELIDEPEPIHTFADWKKRGYFVKKGEKAIARFTIWNFTEKASKLTKANRELAGVDPEKPDPHYYMKEACFFKASQVEKATA